MNDVSLSLRAWCGGVLFHETTFSSLRVEGSALFAAHWAEANADASVPLDVDWQQFEVLEKAGYEVCIAARSGALRIALSVYMLRGFQSTQPCTPFA